MKKKHSKYRKIWLLWVALEGLVATFAIMNSFLLLRYLYFSHGTAIPEASVSAAGSVLSAVYLPLLITLILTTGFLEHILCEVYRPCCDMWHLDQTDSVTLLNSLFRLPLYGVFVCHFQQQSGLKGTSKTVGTQ